MAELPDDAPPLESCGFVAVPGPGGVRLWMTCESCGKSDHFWLDGAVRCRCGARYGFALRPDGSQVPYQELGFIPFAEGPIALADTEWDFRRLALLTAVALGALGLIGLLLWRFLG